MTPFSQNFRRRSANSADETPDIAPVSGAGADRNRSHGRGHGRRVALFRLSGALLIAVLGLTLPGLRNTQPIALLTITIPVVLINTVAVGRLGGRRSFRRLAAISDLVAAGVLVLFVPSGFAIALMVIIGLIPLYTFWLDRPAAIEIIVCALGLFSMIGASTDIENWPILMGGFALVAVALAQATAVAVDTIGTNHERFDSLVAGLDAIIWESDDPARRRIIGGRIEQVLGVSIDPAHDLDPIHPHMHPGDLGTVTSTYEALVTRAANSRTGHDPSGHRQADDQQHPRTVSLDYRIIDDHGAIRHLNEKITMSITEGGDTVHRGIITDDTSMITAERAKRSFDEFVRRVSTAMLVLELESTPPDTDPDAEPQLRVVAANTAAIDLFEGYTDHLVGRRFDSELGIDVGLLDELRETVEEDLERPGTALQLPFSESIYSVRTVSLPPDRVGMILDDVTAFARTTEALQRRATHDDLTGLPNRAQFADQLEAAIRACNSATDSTTVAVLMIDLNKFKAVNDTYGHEYGDKLLVEVARRLTRNVRGCDTISRLGGDEFAAIVRSSDIERSVNDVGERIEQLIREPFQIMGQTLTIGASIGIAVRRQSLLSARTLVRDADHAMYRAKAAGGGIVHHDGRPTTRGVTMEGSDSTTSAR